MFPETVVVLLIAEPRGADVGYLMQHHLPLVLDPVAYGDGFLALPAERLAGEFYFPSVMREPDHNIFEEVRERLILRRGGLEH